MGRGPGRLAGWLLAALLLLPAGGRAGDLSPAAPGQPPEEPAAVNVLDDLGRVVTVPVRVVRVVSLQPALTESVCALGACGRLVGVDRFSNWPVPVQSLPRLGSYRSFNIEALVALRPDLVLAPVNASLVGSLRRLGLSVLAFNPERYDDIAGVLERLGQALGLPACRAQTVWQDIEQQMLALSTSLPPRVHGMRTYVEIDPQPFVAGPASFLGDLLRHLGLENVAPDAGQPFLPLSPEWVLEADPALMIISDPGRSGMAALRARPGWARLDAVRAGRVCLFSGQALDVLVRPGPRVAEGAGLIRDCALRHAPE